MGGGRVGFGMGGLGFGGGIAAGCLAGGVVAKRAGADVWLLADCLAPGLLLVREAGGVVRDRTGAEATLFSREAVAASPGVAEDFAARSAGSEWQ